MAGPQSRCPTDTGTTAAGSVRGRAPAHRITGRTRPAGSLTGRSLACLDRPGAPRRSSQAPGSYRSLAAWPSGGARPARGSEPSSMPCAGPGTTATRRCRSTPGCPGRPAISLVGHAGAGRAGRRPGERHRLEGGRPSRTGDALVVATSGTTGEPKGVVQPMPRSAPRPGPRTPRLGTDPDSDRWLACLPLHHVAASRS